jgi:uncharacterized protein (TIRG00374 family)
MMKEVESGAPSEQEQSPQWELEVEQNLEQEERDRELVEEQKRELELEVEVQQEPARPLNRRLALGIIIVIIIFGAVVVALDWKNVRLVIGQADWILTLPALGFTALSYSCVSYTFVLVNRAFGIRVSRRDLFEISLVTIIINHLLTTGGAAGYGIRLLMLRERGAEVKDIAAATLFHIYLDGLGMLALLPMGLAYLLLKHPFSAKVSIGIGVVAGILGIVFFMATLLVLVTPLRRRILKLASRLVRAVLHRDITWSMEEFDESMTRGVVAIRQRPLLAVGLILLTILDWTASMTALWFCFDALGEPLGVEVLIAGFSIGLTAGALSMVPGGLGVQEGSIAGVYALLGAPFRQAILAAILFRVVYYLIPYVLSLGFYGRLLRYRARRGTSGG